MLIALNPKNKVIVIDASTEDSLPEHNFETLTDTNISKTNHSPTQELSSGTDEIKILESSVDNAIPFNPDMYNTKA